MYLVVTASTYSSSSSSACFMPSESCLQIIIIMRYLLLWFTSVNNYARLYIKSNPHLTYSSTFIFFFSFMLLLLQFL